MESLYKFLRGLLVLLALAAVAGAFACIAVFFYGLHRYALEEGVWANLDYSESQLLVDGLAENGIATKPLDPDEPLLKQRTILVAEGMNELSARHVVERLLHLNGLDPEAPIELLLNTSGGWTDSAFAIIDTMRSIDAPVNVTATGGCYSAGTLILAAATGERRATPGAVMSVHVNDYYRDEGEFDTDTQELRRFRRVYERYTDAPREWFDTPGDNQYYFDAERALEIGLIDAVAEPKWKAPEASPERRRPAA